MQLHAADEIRAALPPARCVEVMAAAMRAASADEVAVPPRMHMPLVDDSATLLVMPGSSADPAYYGAKLVSMHPDNPASGLPAIQGVIVLFEHASGRPVAILDAATVTELRTAAASALATRELARSDASTHGVLGTGVQALAHIAAVAAVRPISRVVVWGRDESKAAQLAERAARQTGVAVTAGDRAEAAACDIVSCVTGAAEPVLHATDVAAGAHINLVGAHTAVTREADTSLMARARIFVDGRRAALVESGDILIPIAEGELTEEAIVGEIGEVLLGRVAGRTSDEDTTVYKSLGSVAQDLFAAAAVLEAAPAAHDRVQSADSI